MGVIVIVSDRFGCMVGTLAIAGFNTKYKANGIAQKQHRTQKVFVVKAFHS